MDFIGGPQTLLAAEPSARRIFMVALCLLALAFHAA